MTLQGAFSLSCQTAYMSKTNDVALVCILGTLLNDEEEAAIVSAVRGHILTNMARPGLAIDSDDGESALLFKQVRTTVKQ